MGLNIMDPPNKNGGNNLFCDHHFREEITEFIPSIFIAIMVHDELVFSAKFQKSIYRHKDVRLAEIDSRPWCCFIGDDRMKLIYEHVYKHTGFLNYSGSQRKNPFQEK